jgi:hypothetical protein
MSPSLSSINQNLLMTSDLFIVPTSPDYFSVMAIDSLATVLPRWHAWAKRAMGLPVLSNADYPFPNTTPRLLGVIIQKYRPRGGVPAAAFQVWIDEINKAVSGKLIPTLGRDGMLLPTDAYKAAGLSDDYCLSTIPDFNSLIAMSQENRTPVFALSPEQIKQQGVVLEQTIKSRDQFEQTFSDLANKVTSIASYGPGD